MFNFYKFINLFTKSTFIKQKKFDKRTVFKGLEAVNGLIGVEEKKTMISELMTKALFEAKQTKFEGIVKSDKGQLKAAVTERYNKSIGNSLELLKGIKKQEIDYQNWVDALDEDSLFFIKAKVKISSLKEDKDFKYSSYISLGKKRSEMPQIDKDNYLDVINHFASKDGIKVKKSIKALNKLNPSQNEFNNDKITSILKDLSNGEKFKVIFFISKDNYIVDGHHNWAAGLEFDENMEVTCYKINLPIKDLLKRLNLMKITTKEDVNGQVKKGFDINEVVLSDETRESLHHKAETQVLTELLIEVEDSRSLIKGQLGIGISDEIPEDLNNKSIYLKIFDPARGKEGLVDLTVGEAISILNDRREHLISLK